MHGNTLVLLRRVTDSEFQTIGQAMEEPEGRVRGVAGPGGWPDD